MSYRIKYGASQRAAVFAALYNAAKCQGMGRLHYVAGDITARKGFEWLAKMPAVSLRSQGAYFDYCKGRVMKTHIGLTCTGDMGLYDRDNGEGAAWAAVKDLQGVEQEVIDES